MRNGFTLVEMIVTVTVAVVIFSASYMVWGLANRSRGVTASARALQTALLIQEQLADDLGRLIRAGPAPVRWVEGKEDRLSFYTVDPVASVGRKLVVRGVAYARDPASGYLRRTIGAAHESVGVSPLTSVAFVPFESPTGPLLRVSLLVGREKGEPEGPDTAHSFLVRIPVSRQHPSLQIDAATPFASDEDKPRRQELLPP